MEDQAPLTRHRAAHLLIGCLGALCLAVPTLAGPAGGPEQQNEAANVARKVEKAVATAHQATGEREALRHFQEVVAEYAELHAQQLVRLGTPESAAAQQALADAIGAKRAKAQPGDLFQPEIQPLFRRLIAEQLAGPDTLDARKAVLEGNPGDEKDAAPVVVRVNAVYPSGAPRSTVPPSLLATLPPLPAALHYRFVGRDLVLVDSVAQMIVDFLPTAAPELAIP